MNDYLNLLLDFQTLPREAKARTFMEVSGQAHYENVASNILAFYFDPKDMIQELGDDVQMKTLKYYFAFRRLKNFVCVEVHTKTRNLLVFVKHPDPASVAEEKFARDVTNVGHFGTGNLELTLPSDRSVILVPARSLVHFMPHSFHLPRRS